MEQFVPDELRVSIVAYGQRSERDGIAMAMVHATEAVQATCRVDSFGFAGAHLYIAFRAIPGAETAAVATGLVDPQPGVFCPFDIAHDFKPEHGGRTPTKG